MRRGLRFVAIGVPVLMSLAVNIVLARPSKMTANIETNMNETQAPVPTTSDIVRLFVR